MLRIATPKPFGEVVIASPQRRGSVWEDVFYLTQFPRGCIRIDFKMEAHWPLVNYLIRVTARMIE
jgi:hypothetical protein